MTYNIRTSINNSKKNLRYFESIADSIDEYRKYRQYYWNEISQTCNYFSQEDNVVLEIGCGTGDLLNKIKASKKVGIDFSPKMIKNARKKYPNIDFYEMQAEKIDLAEKFDLIIISNLIGFIDDVQLMFKELRNVCHKRTKIIINYYSFFWEPIVKFAEFIGIKKKTPFLNWLSTSDIKNLLYISGFETYRSTTRMLIPYKIPILSFLLNKILVRLPFFNMFGLNCYIFTRILPESILNNKEDNPSASIIIPIKNEEGNIKEILERIPVFTEKIEIIFIEGHSTDNSWNKLNEVFPQYLDKFDIVLLKQKGKGKGDAVRKGFSEAKNDILLILDADMTVPPEELPKFYNILKSGKADFINGARLVYKMEKNAMRFFNMLGNKFFSIIFSWLLDQPLKDTLCGTKAIFKVDYEKIKKNRYFFGDFDPFGDFDLLFGAFKLNLRIIELPIKYRERKYGKTNISRFKHGFILLRMALFACFKIKFY